MTWIYSNITTTNGGNIYTGTNLAQVYVTSSGTHTVTFTASTSTTQLLVEKAGTVTQTFYIDNVKVEQSTPTLTSYPIADVVSAQHYYPYHSTMQTWEADGKEYTFGGANGQEKDKEIRPDLYGALFWEYDSRLGGNGRWNVDPKPHPGISPYVTFFNNPIFYSDKDGDSSEYYDSKGNKLHTSHDKLPNAVVVIPDANLVAFNKVLKLAKTKYTKALDGYNTNKIFRGYGISYTIEDYWRFYDKNEKNYHDGSRMTPKYKKDWPLVNETGAALKLIDKVMTFEDINKQYIGDPDGVGVPRSDAIIHTHAEEGTDVKMTSDGSPGHLKTNAEGGHDDDISNSPQKPGTGIFDVGVTKTEIRLYDSKKVRIVLKRNQLFKKQ